MVVHEIWDVTCEISHQQFHFISLVRDTSQYKQNIKITETLPNYCILKFSFLKYFFQTVIISGKFCLCVCDACLCVLVNVQMLSLYGVFNVTRSLDVDIKFVLGPGSFVKASCILWLFKSILDYIEKKVIGLNIWLWPSFQTFFLKCLMNTLADYHWYK